MRVLKETEAIEVNLLEKDVKCKWRWEWLKQEVKFDVAGVQHSLPLEQHFHKIDKAGFAKCTICVKEVNYSTKGVYALTTHCTRAIHKEKVCTIMTNMSVAPPPVQGGTN